MLNLKTSSRKKTKGLKKLANPVLTDLNRIYLKIDQFPFRGMQCWNLSRTYSW